MIAAVNGKEVTPGSINIEKDNIEELMKNIAVTPHATSPTAQ